MSRFHVYAAIAALFALPAAAQTTSSCNLTVTISCSTPGSSASCQSTTLNSGTTVCTGQFVSGFWIIGPNAGTVTNFKNSLGLTDCFDSSIVPVANEGFSFCMGDASLAPGGSFTASADITGQGQIYAVTMVNDAAAFAQAGVSAPTCTPNISSPPVAQSGGDYTVTWTAISDPTAQYILDESTTSDFTSGVTETQVNGFSKTFSHSVLSATTYYYRVKATNCASGTPDWSGIARTVVQAQSSPASKNPQVTLPFGTTQTFGIPVFIPGVPGNATFTASTDKPYLTVSPSSGPLPSAGTTVMVMASPGGLPAGTTSGTLTVVTTATTSLATNTPAITGTTTTTTNTPVSINLVTPVQPGALDTPPPNALVIPVVTHVNSGSGPFLSDVRLTNASGQPMNYLVTMAPVGPQVTTPGATPTAALSTTLAVGPQQTAALNDIVKNFFGYGATGDVSDTGFGSLTVRPVDSASFLTFAASRTYTTQSIGTFGQFIAAIPFSKFATLAVPPIPIGGVPHTVSKLSLQQIAQSSFWRTNIGLAEGSGQPAFGVLHFFDDAGKLLKDVPFELKAGEVQQTALGNLLGPLTDGRVEVEITSPTGAVTAYASVIDATTTDPFEVMPVDVSAVSSTRYVLPGISELNNGANNFHSDVRIFNGGSSDVTATLSFSPIAGLPGAAPKTLTIKAGQIARLDNILPTLFQASGTGGSVIVTTPQPSSLVATANTYTLTDKGTFGQFIPGVTPDQGIGLGDRALQVMQLEQSDQFHSNVGVAELTGNPVTVEVSLYEPDSKTTPFIDVELGPNEFKQLNAVIATFFGETGQTYNARVSVQVKSGTGRVSAYGSIIDNQSKDPTYAPAQ